ncbi:MAG: nitroreductase family protein [Anaerovoracaceae bacterium]
MQDILENLITRRSIRKYKPDAVPENLLDEIIKAGLYAPTGMNRQQTIILKITDQSVVRELGKVNGKLMGRDGFDGFYGAPAVLCVLSKKDNPNAVYDGCSVISNMLNEAASLGLGSCWVHRGKEQFHTEEGMKILRSAGIDPVEYVGVDNVIVGYMDCDMPKAAPRKEGRVFSIE